MSLRNLKNNELQALNSVDSRKTELTPARVFSVILDNSHPKYTGEDSIGTIFYGKVDLNEASINLDNLNRAKPIFSFVKYFPLINEIVLVFNSTSNNIYKDVKGDSSFVSTYYFPNLNIWNNSQHNALPLERELKGKTNPQEASLGIEQNNVEKANITLGDYFVEKDDLKSIQPFEGDMILEGRFGNAIRLGSSTPQGKNNWSEGDNTGDPITIISNGQPQVSGDTVLEDVNNTDSIIVMTSNQNINNLEVASNNLQSLNTTFEPLSDDQVLIEDTPEPEIVEVEEPQPEVEEEFTETTDVETVEEPVIVTPTPTTPSPVSAFGDPIFDLLDEAVEEGTLIEDDSYSFEDAGQDGGEDPEADPELDENRGNNGENGGGGDDYDIRVETKGNFKLEFKTGRTNNIGKHGNTDNYVNGVYWAKVNENNIRKSPKRNLMLWTRNLDNIWVGNGRFLDDFNKNPLVANPGKRNIKYLYIHWTGGNPNREAAEACLYGHIQPDLKGGNRIDGAVEANVDGSSKGIIVYDTDGATELYKSKYQRNGWNAGGYHWGIEKNGRCFRFYEDYQTTNGVTNSINKHSININWIGGQDENFSQMSLEQAKIIEKLVREYIRIYPDIQIRGHYQSSGNKICPGFWVPAFVKGLGFPDKNIYWDSPHYNSDKKSSKGKGPTLLENAKTMLERLHYTWDPSFEFRDGAA